MNSRLFCQVFIVHLVRPIEKKRNVLILMPHSATINISPIEHKWETVKSPLLKHLASSTSEFALFFFFHLWVTWTFWYFKHNILMLSHFNLSYFENNILILMHRIKCTISSCICAISCVSSYILCCRKFAIRFFALW